jgi:natural product precursor
MLKTTKKLKLNREQLRVLTDENLERVNGGFFRANPTTDWCSSDTMKCTHGCNSASAACANR